MSYDIEVLADRYEAENEVMSEVTSPKLYEISFYAYLPAYGDFDQEFLEMEFPSEAEALEWVRKRYKWIKSDIHIKEIVKL